MAIKKENELRVKLSLAAVVTADLRSFLRLFLLILIRIYSYFVFSYSTSPYFASFLFLPLPLSLSLPLPTFLCPILALSQETSVGFEFDGLFVDLLRPQNIPQRFLLHIFSF